MSQIFEYDRADVNSETQGLKESFYESTSDEQILGMKIGIFVSLFGFVLTSASAVLSWYLWVYHKNTLWLIHSILCTFAVVFAVMLIISGSMALRYLSDVAKYGYKRPPSQCFFKLGFAGALFYFGYCIVSAVAFFIYRYWQYSWMLMAYGNDQLKKEVFENSTFSNVWDINKWMMNVMCLCLL